MILPEGWESERFRTKSLCDRFYCPGEQLSSDKPYTDKQLVDGARRALGRHHAHPPVTPKRFTEKLAPESALTRCSSGLSFNSRRIEKRMDIFVRPFDLTMQRMGVFCSSLLQRPAALAVGARRTALRHPRQHDGSDRRARLRGARAARAARQQARPRTRPRADRTRPALVEEYVPHHRRALAGLLGALDAEERKHPARRSCCTSCAVGWSRSSPSNVTLPMTTAEQLTNALSARASRRYARRSATRIGASSTRSARIRPRSLPRSTEAGFLAALIPEEYGGAGLALAEACIILEEINRSGGNAAACHAQMYTWARCCATAATRRSGASCRRSRAASCGCKRSASPSRRAGSTRRRSRTTAVRDGDHYVVNGQKVWISRAEHSDLMLLLARTTPLEAVQARATGSACSWSTCATRSDTARRSGRSRR